MGDERVPPIGPRLREERTRRNVTIRGLAREVGVSPSLISQIETGKSQPSVSTLYALTSALGLPLEELFGEAPPPALSAVLGDGAVDRTHGVGPHVAPGEGEVLTLASGVTWRRLGQVPDHHVDFLLVTYEPGGASSAEGELMRHRGTEYGYLVSGDLEVRLGFESFTMTAGESVCFESATPHRYHNAGEVPAVGVWFVTED
jgi:DNA-binding XRE family transcriptional regulator/mannose-6-phosphate isomerase-like protein (cupin superfamily)